MIKFHNKALDEVNEYGESTIEKFKRYFKAFDAHEKLAKSKFKKLRGTELYEFRVRLEEGTFRALGGFVKPDLVILLVFQKKTQKTPNNIIKLARKRLNELL
jgi:phage-related protein